MPNRAAPTALLLILCAGVAHAANAANAATAAEPPYEHRIEPGDTLIGLRGRVIETHADWRVLQRLNRIANPRRLQPGRLLLIPRDMLLSQPEAVEVAYARGQVMVQRSGSAPAVPLAGGDRLGLGDQVATGPGAVAMLRFADGSQLLLRADSRLVVERSHRAGSTERRDIRVQLGVGDAETRVPPPAATPTPMPTQTPASPSGPGAAAPPAPTAPTRRFEIRTPLVNLGVRGTEFRSASSADVARVEVLSGRVAAGAQIVTAGQGALATRSGVSAPMPLPAAPSLQDLPARLERLPLELSWPAQPGASAYRAQLFEAEPPGRLMAEGRFAEPRARWSDDLADGRYLLRLRAIGAQGLEGLDSQAGFELKARPEPPILLSPAAEASGTEPRLRFAWARHPAARHYRLQLASDARFEQLLLDRDGLTDTDIELEVPLGLLHWRVASVRQVDGRADPGPWGDAQRYTRLPPPPPPPKPPQQLPPQPNAEGLQLSWSAGPPGTRYRLQLARSADFSAPLVDQQLDQPGWLLRDAEPGVYHVRVLSLDADGRAGPWGSAQQVEVARRWPWWLLALPLLLLL